ncbi:MAG TPA: hypothetical protein ACQGQX_00100, partial [Xylella taiwanensis]
QHRLQAPYAKTWCGVHHIKRRFTDLYRIQRYSIGFWNIQNAGPLAIQYAASVIMSIQSTDALSISIIIVGTVG